MQEKSIYKYIFIFFVLWVAFFEKLSILSIEPLIILQASFMQFNVFKELEEKLNLSWEDLFYNYVKEKVVHKGSTHYIPCFSHWENTPSFGINFNKKIMKCFGCGKGYGNILLFLKDYLALSPQDLIAKLHQDGFIKDIESLWDQFFALLENDTRKQIYKFFEISKSEQHPLMQRLLFSVGGIGYITEKKLKDLKKSNKFKKDFQQKIVDQTIELFEKHIDEYLLISDEYHLIAFYSTQPWSKAHPAFQTKLDFNFVYNEDENSYVDSLKKDILLEQSFVKQMRWNESINLWKEKKQKQLFSGEWYNDFLVKKFEIDSAKYQENLLKMFYQQNNRVHYFIGEGIFDMYSMGVIGVPIYTAWTGFEANKANVFIRHLSKKIKRTDEYQINLCFDNDKAGIKGSIRFLNQYAKLLKSGIIQSQQLNINIFNFAYFETKISRLLTILSHMGSKRTALEEMLQSLYTKSLGLTPYKQIPQFENVLLENFSEMPTDYNVIEKFRAKYEFNYQEKTEEKREKTKIFIKDFGDLPLLIFGIEVYLEKISEVFAKNSSLEPSKKQELINAFVNLVCFAFNSFFFESFVDLDAYKELIDKKLTNNEIEQATIDSELSLEDYLFSNSMSFQKFNEEKALVKHLGLIHQNIDIELEALSKLNFLCYDWELAEQFLLNPTEIKAIRKSTKEELKEFMPKNIGEFLESLAKQKIKIDEDGQKIAEGNATKELELQFEKQSQEWEKNSKKAILYLNIWKNLCGEKPSELIYKALISQKYSEWEAQKIIERDKQYLNTPMAIISIYVLNYYEKIRELLEQNIKTQIEDHWEQHNVLNTVWFKKALYKLKRKWQVE